jgi:hypothetical protein
MAARQQIIVAADLREFVLDREHSRLGIRFSLTNRRSLAEGSGIKKAIQHR